MADTDGMRKLAPGAYVDADGALHIDGAEMCEAAGYDPTPENIARLERAAAVAAENIGAAFETVERGNK